MACAATVTVCPAVLVWSGKTDGFIGCWDIYQANLLRQSLYTVHDSMRVKGLPDCAVTKSVTLVIQLWFHDFLYAAWLRYGDGYQV